VYAMALELFNRKLAEGDISRTESRAETAH
jgi:hypothetical protein